MRIVGVNPVSVTTPGVATSTVLTDAGASIQGAVVAPGVVWHRITIAGDATDLARQFLDITGVESSGDVAMALYHEDGRLGGIADGTALGNTAISSRPAGIPEQLSFGIGRRPAPANGVQFAGQSGQLFAGTFYLAVGVRGQVTFGQDFAAAGSGSGSAQYAITLATNTGGTALSPAAAPTLLQDLGVLASRGRWMRSPPSSPAPPTSRGIGSRSTRQSPNAPSGPSTLISTSAGRRRDRTRRR